jgi:hypothetical protein
LKTEVLSFYNNLKHWLGPYACPRKNSIMFEDD